MSTRLLVRNVPLVLLAVSNALQGVASKLPAETRVFCGHEYTVSNLQFALSVEPENKAVSDKLAWSRRTLATGGYTVPSTASIVAAFRSCRGSCWCRWSLLVSLETVVSLSPSI